MKHVIGLLNVFHLYIWITAPTLGPDACREEVRIVILFVTCKAVTKGRYAALGLLGLVTLWHVRGIWTDRYWIWRATLSLFHAPRTQAFIVDYRIFVTARHAQPRFFAKSYRYLPACFLCLGFAYIVSHIELTIKVNNVTTSANSLTSFGQIFTMISSLLPLITLLDWWLHRADPPLHVPAAATNASPKDLELGTLNASVSVHEGQVNEREEDNGKDRVVSTLAPGRISASPLNVHAEPRRRVTFTPSTQFQRPLPMVGNISDLDLSDTQSLSWDE